MMKAVRFHGNKDIRLEDIPIPICGPDQVIIRPAFTGICGTDPTEYERGPLLISPTNPNALTGEKVPLVLGHEFSGIVEEIGSEVLDISVGDHVTVQPFRSDMTCVQCKNGLYTFCEKLAIIGLGGGGGGLSEKIAIPRRNAFKLHESIPLDIGALVEPLAVGYHGVRISQFKEGDSALVLGAGPIGLAVVCELKARGAKPIIVSTASQKRLQLAREFGAHYIIDRSREDVVRRCLDITDEVGVDYVFDTAGAQEAADTGVAILKPRGSMVNLAVWPGKMTIDPNTWLWKEIKYIPSLAYQDEDFNHVIEALANGTISPRNMITRKVSLEEAEEKAFKELLANKDEQVKILIEVNK